MKCCRLIVDGVVKKGQRGTIDSWLKQISSALGFPVVTMTVREKDWEENTDFAGNKLNYRIHFCPLLEKNKLTHA